MTGAPRKYDYRAIAMMALEMDEAAIARKVGCHVVTVRAAMRAARDYVAPPVASPPEARQDHSSTVRPLEGFTLYRGPSMLDGAPIVCIVTNPYQSRVNLKTEDLVQTYIFQADIPPLEAIESGDDASVCGGCRHRGNDGAGRSCYVQLWGGPRNIWLAHSRGKYRDLNADDARARLAGRVVRLGSYGDPASLPIMAWRRALGDIAACVGYTHQWRTCDEGFKRWCMASVDSPGEREDAKAAGWRTFRVRPRGAGDQTGEVICPGSVEAGKKTNCSDCRACGGLGAKARADIVIAAHGDPGKIRAFEFESFRRERPYG